MVFNEWNKIMGIVDEGLNNCKSPTSDLWIVQEGFQSRPKESFQSSLVYTEKIMKVAFIMDLGVYICRDADAECALRCDEHLQESTRYWNCRDFNGMALCYSFYILRAISYPSYLFIELCPRYKRVLKSEEETAIIVFLNVCSTDKYLFFFFFSMEIQRPSFTITIKKISSIIIIIIKNKV